MTIQQDANSFKGRWIVVGTLTSGVAMALSSIFVIGLLLPDIAEDLDLSPVQQGWLGASVVFGNLFLAIPLNLWLSRYRPWRVAVITFLGIGGFTLLQAFAPEFRHPDHWTRWPWHQLHSQSVPKSFDHPAVVASRQSTSHNGCSLRRHRSHHGRHLLPDSRTQQCSGAVGVPFL